MPVISRFFGIAMRMYRRDPAPRHFHACSGEYEIVGALEDLVLIEGRIPPRVQRLVTARVLVSREALRADWMLARAGRPPPPIPP